MNGQRLAKYIAACGLTSRRSAEKWILEGRVRVNGHLITDLSNPLQTGDRVLIDGKEFSRPSLKIWRYHKPRGLLVTHHDPQQRPTVFDVLRPSLGHVLSVGRLDLNSEGLLLLTNNGTFARLMERNAFKRIYRVRVWGEVSPQKLEKCLRGIERDGVCYQAHKITITRQIPQYTWLSITLKSGKNREIRRLMEACDLRVLRLIRVSYDRISLEDLRPAAFEPIPQKIVAGYEDQLAQSNG